MFFSKPLNLLATLLFAALIPEPTSSLNAAGTSRAAFTRDFLGAAAAAAAAATSTLPVPALATDMDSVFLGRYSDPKHPGGIRDISLTGSTIGAYKLAKVDGGGGRGEPATYTLPAVIIERKNEPAPIIIE